MMATTAAAASRPTRSASQARDEWCRLLAIA